MRPPGGAVAVRLCARRWGRSLCGYAPAGGGGRCAELPSTRRPSPRMVGGHDLGAMVCVVVGVDDLPGAKPGTQNTSVCGAWRPASPVGLCWEPGPVEPGRVSRERADGCVPPFRSTPQGVLRVGHGRELGGRFPTQLVAIMSDSDHFRQPAGRPLLAVKAALTGRAERAGAATPTRTDDLCPRRPELWR
jgi:hypothetical protein